jgi:hypothetical protein
VFTVLGLGFVYEDLGLVPETCLGPEGVFTVLGLGV